MSATSSVGRVSVGASIVDGGEGDVGGGCGGSGSSSAGSAESVFSGHDAVVGKRLETTLAQMKSVINDQREQIELLRCSVDVMSRREMQMARAHDALYKFWVATSSECRRLAEVNCQLSDAMRLATAEVHSLRRLVYDSRRPLQRAQTRV